MNNDPWRYRCKDCGSTQLRYCVTAGKPQYQGVPAAARYHCGGCNSKNNVRKDMKTGELVA